jgi:hypothetical protein
MRSVLNERPSPSDAKKGNYRLIRVWSPEDNDPMRKLGITLPGLAHIKIPAADIY